MTTQPTIRTGRAQTTGASAPAPVVCARPVLIVGCVVMPEVCSRFVQRCPSEAGLYRPNGRVCAMRTALAYGAESIEVELPNDTVTPDTGISVPLPVTDDLGAEV